VLDKFKMFTWKPDLLRIKNYPSIRVRVNAEVAQKEIGIKLGQGNELTRPLNRGFSLVELMVSITIFIMITSITLTNYPRFSNKLSLDLLAQDIALSVRQAQISGSSVLGSKSLEGQEARVFKAYGVRFEAPRQDDNSPYPYLIFADITSTSEFNQYNGPSTYEFGVIPNLSCNQPRVSDTAFSGNPNECLQKFLITGFNKVKFLCANFEDGPAEKRIENCQNDPANRQIPVLDIVFVRPNLDAKFNIGSINPADKAPSSISNVGIVLESPTGEYQKTVVVWKTGQISVE
jgi:prepilin-type N-terminal cleavage/methylation domain-containing protein